MEFFLLIVALAIGVCLFNTFVQEIRWPRWFPEKKKTPARKPAPPKRKPASSRRKKNWAKSSTPRPSRILKATGEDGKRYTIPRLTKAEELVELIEQWIDDRCFVYDGAYPDFTKREVREQLPFWNEKDCTFVLGEPETDYQVDFTPTEWKRCGPLLGEKYKEHDRWNKWWGMRWENFYTVITRSPQLLDKVFAWCEDLESRQTPPLSCLREVIDIVEQYGTEVAEGWPVVALRRGRTLFRHTLETWLVEAGYRQAERVSQCGEYVFRGSLLDIFPVGQDAPLRIDFFDDEVDSIRRFDLVTQQTLERLEWCSITRVTGSSKRTVFRTAEDMLDFMEQYFDSGYWFVMSDELQEDRYREVLTNYVEQSSDTLKEHGGEGLTLSLSDEEWTRLGTMFPAFLIRYKKKNFVINTLYDSITQPTVIRWKVTADTQTLHDLLEPWDTPLEYHWLWSH